MKLAKPKHCLVGFGASAMGGLFEQGGDDDEFDMQIQEGSIEDAEELLARLDKIFVKSSYDIFARNDLMLIVDEETYFHSIVFDGGAVSFIFSSDFMTKAKGECCILISDDRSQLSCSLHFFNENEKNTSAFILKLNKNENTLSEFTAVGDSRYTLGKCFAELQAVGVSFSHSFDVHMTNFINNCINTYNSLYKQGKIIRVDE